MDNKKELKINELKGRLFKKQENALINISNIIGAYNDDRKVILDELKELQTEAEIYGIANDLPKK